MSDKGHLHIDQSDQLGNWIGRALQSAKGGAIEIKLAGEPAVKIAAEAGNITVDLLRADILRVPQDETSLFDNLKTASEFGHVLSENNVTLSFLRKGKEAVRLGKEAHPTLSKAITKSDDIQLTSLTEFAKLKGDLKAD
jgi:hypothetical protein